MKIVHAISSVDGRRKVDFFQHNDETYGFDSLTLGEEGCWYPCGRYSQCHAATLDIAIREAKDRIKWLNDQLMSPGTA